MRKKSEEPLVLRRGVPVPHTAYVIIDSIAEGGMGELFEVVHQALDRRAALKVLHPRFARRSDMVTRMRSEARALASVRHPHIVDVFDYGELPDGRPFLVMELLRGHDLRTELSRLGVLAVPSALTLVLQLLDALEAIHRGALVHRDLKLENIFLCSDGTVRLLDFGLARDLSSDVRHTAQGLCVGTPRSMAPEQYALADPDARTDVYAAGLILFELIVGQGPFDKYENRPGALRNAHCHEQAPPPSAVAPQGVPGSVDGIVLRALAKDPDERFASAREMALQISEVLGERRRARRLPPGADRARAVPTRPEATPNSVDLRLGQTRTLESFEAMGSSIEEPESHRAKAMAPIGRLADLPTVMGELAKAAGAHLWWAAVDRVGRA